jgi:hypothetical protein
VVVDNQTNMLCHERYVHLCFSYIHLSYKHQMASILLQGKLDSVRLLSGKAWKETKVLELIHNALCGPMPTQAMGGANYFMTFIEDSSRNIC